MQNYIKVMVLGVICLFLAIICFFVSLSIFKPGFEKVEVDVNSPTKILEFEDFIVSLPGKENLNIANKNILAKRLLFNVWRNASIGPVEISTITILKRTISNDENRIKIEKRIYSNEQKKTARNQVLFPMRNRILFIRILEKNIVFEISLKTTSTKKNEFDSRKSIDDALFEAMCHSLNLKKNP